MARRVLVTGASGFIGRHVVRGLLADQVRVGALIRERSQDRFGGLGSEVDLLVGHLGDPGPLADTLARWRPQACIHLAWYTNPADYLHSRQNLDCLRDGIALLEVLQEVGCRSVVVAGTCAEYGPVGDRPLTEDSPLAPATLYGACKVGLLRIGQQLAAGSGTRFAWARLFHVFGPGEHPTRLLPSAIMALDRGETFRVGAGHRVRDYVHVTDVASALVALSSVEADGVFNVCSGTPTSIRDLLCEIVGQIGRGELCLGERPAGQWDPPWLYGDPGRLQAITGWQPSFDLVSGVADSIRWWGTRPCDSPEPLTLY